LGLEQTQFKVKRELGFQGEERREEGENIGLGGSENLRGR